MHPCSPNCETKTSRSPGSFLAIMLASGFSRLSQSVGATWQPRCAAACGARGAGLPQPRHSARRGPCATHGRQQREQRAAAVLAPQMQRRGLEPQRAVLLAVVVHVERVVHARPAGEPRKRGSMASASDVIKKTACGNSAKGAGAAVVAVAAAADAAASPPPAASLSASARAAASGTIGEVSSAATRLLHAMQCTAAAPTSAPQYLASPS